MGDRTVEVTRREVPLFEVRASGLSDDVEVTGSPRPPRCTLTAPSLSAMNPPV